MFTKFWALSVLTFAWLAYDWDTHSQGKRRGKSGGPCLHQGLNHGLREVEGESGRNKRRRGEEKGGKGRGEEERKGGVVERRRKEMQSGVRGDGKRGAKLSREQRSLPGGPRRMKRLSFRAGAQPHTVAL